MITGGKVKTFKDWQED